MAPHFLDPLDAKSFERLVQEQRRARNSSTHHERRRTQTDPSLLEPAVRAVVVKRKRMHPLDREKLRCQLGNKKMPAVPDAVAFARHSALQQIGGCIAVVQVVSCADSAPHQRGARGAIQPTRALWHRCHAHFVSDTAHDAPTSTIYHTRFDHLDISSLGLRPSRRCHTGPRGLESESRGASTALD